MKIVEPTYNDNGLNKNISWKNEKLLHSHLLHAFYGEMTCLHQCPHAAFSVIRSSGYWVSVPKDNVTNLWKERLKQEIQAAKTTSTISISLRPTRLAICFTAWCVGIAAKLIFEFTTAREQHWFLLMHFWRCNLSKKLTLGRVSASKGSGVVILCSVGLVAVPRKSANLQALLKNRHLRDPHYRFSWHNLPPLILHFLFGCVQPVYSNYRL